LTLDEDRFRILYVCTGNICRSPMAERLTRRGLKLRIPSQAHRIAVESAGTWGHEGAPMEPHAAEMVNELGGDPGGFRGRELLEEHVVAADLVLTATRDHRAHVVSMGHSAGLRTFTLKEFTRLISEVDLRLLPTHDVVVRARCLVQAAAALRGRHLPLHPTADEIDDPYGAPMSVYRTCGVEISTALETVLDVLAGVRIPHG
jgi:protein-tyrosine phosphatase